MSAGAMRQPNVAVLIGLAWLLVAAQLLFQNWAGTAETLNDTDDAMRLVEMRAFLAGQGWFDLHEARVAPFSYDSHWSRLIDAGLAGFFVFFKLFADTALAERLMRVVWPMLWLLPTMAGAVAVAWRLAGREAGLVTLLLAVVGLPALQQFTPGRIDHHNVQIALSVLVLAATVWSDRLRWTAWAAGGLTGLALAIGFECLPFLALCGAAFALRYVVDRSGAAPLATYSASLAASALAAFLVSVGPDRWGRGACDAIAINTVAPLALAGLMLAVAGRRIASERMPTRFTAVAVAGGGAAIVFIFIEPRCLGGPFAMMDREVWPIWLSHVSEMQPLMVLTRDAPVLAAAIAAFPAVAVLATLALLRDGELRRDFGFLVVSAALLVAIAMTIVTAKMYNYAMWLGMPPIAVLALRLSDRLNLKTFAARAFTAVLLTPAVISATVTAVVQAAGHESPAKLDTPEKRGCFKTENYTPLAQLPKGLVATDIDYGPFILALTPHAVIAAPYHRLSSGIVAAHRVFALPPAEARKILARYEAAYLAICGKRAPAGLGEAERNASLWGRLQAGIVPDWLAPVPATAGQPFTVYRVR